MQDTELFLSLAEIAGVFLGFGALIGVRSASTSDAFELTSIREVVVMGTQVIVVALVPVTLSHYGITGHEVWLLSSSSSSRSTGERSRWRSCECPSYGRSRLPPPWARRAVSMLLFVPLNVALFSSRSACSPTRSPPSTSRRSYSSLSLPRPSCWASRSRWTPADCLRRPCRAQAPHRALRSVRRRDGTRTGRPGLWWSAGRQVSPFSRDIVTTARTSSSVSSCDQRHARRCLAPLEVAPADRCGRASADLGTPHVHLGRHRSARRSCW